MTRKLWWPVLVIGIALIVLPFAISLPSRASHGQSMIDNFHAIMQPAAVAKTVNYDKQTFTALRPVAVNGVSAAAEVPRLVPALATASHMTPAQLQQYLGKNYPALSGMLNSLPSLTPVFKRVPPGLDWYAPIVNTMQQNVGNYASISSLPSFRLFTWFFVAPGVLLVMISSAGLGVQRWVRMPQLARHQPLTH